MNTANHGNHTKILAMCRRVLSCALGSVLVLTGALGIAGMQALAPTKAGVVQQAYAATKNFKKSGIPLNLKNGKAFASKMWWAGAGLKKYSVKVSGYKLSDAKKTGRKQLVFDVTWTRKWKPTSAEVSKMVQASAKWYGKAGKGALASGNGWFFLADYYSGVNLESLKAAPYGVESSAAWAVSGTKKFKGTNGYWAKIWTTMTARVQVTFPAGYDGLCVGVGCMNRGLKAAKQEKWDSGQVAYQKTPWCRSDRKNVRFKRVTPPIDGLESLRAGTVPEVAGYTVSVPTARKIASVTSKKKSIATARKRTIEGAQYLVVDFKKAGKVNVTYKVEGKKRKIRFDVQEYANPLSRLKVGETDYHALFDAGHDATTENLLAGKLSLKAAAGWKLDGIVLEGDFGKKTAKAAANGDELVGKKVARMTITLHDKATGAEEQVVLVSGNECLSQKARAVLGA